jgi:predicted oxidoreductase (fatty acid repression mutant protein)
MRLILLFFAEVIAYLVPCCTQLYETQFPTWSDHTSNALLFAAVYFLLMT